MQKIKSSDKVIVIAGKDKGKTGTVQKILGPRKVLVEGINMIKKHVRGNPQAGKPGGIIEKESKIDISNIAILNPTTDKADKVGFKILEKDNQKVRVFKSTGEVIDV